jgi:hypothetical protein
MTDFSDVTVCIPWREQPSRLLPFLVVNDFYTDALPGCAISTADAGGEEFNRAASRNLAVAQAETSMVVIADADTIPPIDTLHRALELADDDGLLHFPFDRGVYLDQAQTSYITEGVGGTPVWRGDEAKPHSSGAAVIRKESYWRAGGQDWRFTGWGGEDDAFLHACRAILGRVQRHDGVAMILWHEAVRDIGSERWQPNSDLALRYQDAHLDPLAMSLLMSEKWREPLGSLDFRGLEAHRG